MALFVSLNKVSGLTVAEVGELAWELAQFEQRGCSVVPSGVIVASVLEQALAMVVSREPLLADWPLLLGQQDLAEAESLRRLLQRLKRALAMAPVDLPWQAMGQTLPTPVVRLQPSLYLPGMATAPLGHLLGDVVCWGNEQSLSQGLKRLWGRLFSAHSWAYWQRSRRGAGGAGPQPSPQGLRMAVLLQPVVPSQVTGTVHLRPHQLRIQAIQGYLQGLTAAIPDRYQGSYGLEPEGWQRGTQDWVYQPTPGTQPVTNPDDPLVIRPALETTLASLASAPLSPFIQQLQRCMTPQRPTWYGEWQWRGADEPLQLTQALPWPLTPPGDSPPIAAASSPQRWVGQGAVPGQAIAPALVVPAGENPPNHPDPHILVAAQILPTWLPQLTTAVALVSEQGGLTSHAAILARELGIPAVVGLPHATREMVMGESLRLDGDAGIVERFVTDTPLPAAAPAAPDLPIALPATAPELWVNLTQPEQAAAAAQFPVAGVGLLRSEWLMLSSLEHRHPYQWITDGDAAVLQQRLVAQLTPIVSAFAPRPVRYRSLDLRSHEMANLLGAPTPETNPMLGMRGTFSYQQHPDLFQVELAALRQLQQAGHDNLQLLLPFVRTVEEFQYCHAQVQAMGLDEAAPFQLWMMAEVPSVLFLLPDYQAAGADGIAIGTNDLTQLILGVDRDQAALSDAFNETHPAVRAAIAQLLTQAQSLGLPTSICGVAPSRYPALVTAWVRQGITGLSVDMAALGDTAQAMAAAMVEEGSSPGTITPSKRS
jgi:pyruvate,water dikinase